MKGTPAVSHRLYEVATEADFLSTSLTLAKIVSDKCDHIQVFSHICWLASIRSEFWWYRWLTDFKQRTELNLTDKYSNWKTWVKTVR